MPELPEVETITRQLSVVLPGKIIDHITINLPRSFIGDSRSLSGLQIHSVTRRQKIIIITLANPQNSSSLTNLLIHLKMTGQLIYVPTSFTPGVQNSSTPGVDSASRIVGGHPTSDWIGQLPSKHTRVIIQFTDKSNLYFNDQRTFGWMKLLNSQHVTAYFDKFPPDVTADTFTLVYFHSVLSKSNRAIKLVILDQALMGGMGNIYANDALFLAGIYPNRPAKSLTSKEVKLLFESMRSVVQKGIATGGASYSNFVGIDGLGGHYQDHFLVYGKAQSPCLKCGHLLEKIKIGGRGSIFCPVCQK